MRFTVIDEAGSISFRGPGHALKMLTAACCSDPGDHRALLTALANFDLSFGESVRIGLSIFDEHCTRDDPQTVTRWLTEVDAEHDGPFRVLNETSRRASLESGRLGLVIFNLPARRIVQVENRYGSLLRQDRGRIRELGRPVNRYYRYALPTDWAIVP